MKEAQTWRTQRIEDLAGASPQAVAFQVGVLTSVYALAQLIAGPLAGRLCDRIGRRATLLGGLAGLAATQAAFGLSASLRLLYAQRLGRGWAPGWGWSRPRSMASPSSRGPSSSTP